MGIDDLEKKRKNPNCYVNTHAREHREKQRERAGGGREREREIYRKRQS